MNDFRELIIDDTLTILSAIKVMDELKRKLLIVADGVHYKGLLSIGDIQRAIIKNQTLSVQVSTIIRNDYVIADPSQSIEEIKKLMKSMRAEFMPVVDQERNLVRVHFWEDLFIESTKEPLFTFNLPVVIMAGGFGTRLKPLTNVLPKPLIPINEKTFIEEIFDRFNTHGCNTFFLSLNYKSDLIKYYLSEQNLPFKISYLNENKPMGTAGSLSLLKGKIRETFFVSNCDILIEQDYSEVLKYHNENNNEITVVAALKHFPLAYGTIETGNNGSLLSLIEKPELTFQINSGMYILEPHLISEIPENRFYHITSLIEKLISENRNVGVFPVSEGSWLDIGEWSEYLKLIHK
jgi:dTDP-glucose pyrophosphorylase